MQPCRQNTACELVRKLHTFLEDDRRTREISPSTAVADREKRAKLESLDRAISDLSERLRLTFTQDAEAGMAGPDAADEEVKPAAAKPPPVPAEPPCADLQPRSWTTSGAEEAR